ncbi:MAG: dTMP kinase [Candidatus Gottesmanbacteria bacterium]|nr:dTMP kinase [Candidatus Gottesmanbacteria bacterium]
MKRAVPAGRQGKLIVFEGVSGTGKETQAKLLQKLLQKYLATKKIISHIVLHPSLEFKPTLRAAKTVQEQLSLLANDRYAKVQTVILPALARGEWVISLRNYISAYVYQGNGKDVEQIDVPPDYLLYFDIDPAIAMKRVVVRGEPIGKFETLKLLKEKRKKYEQVLQTIPHITIDAGASIDEIHRKVLNYIL